MRFKEFLIENQHLLEVAMNPSAFQKWLNSPMSSGMKVGVEFELLVPIASELDELDDFNNLPGDERVPDNIYSIVNFFDEVDNRFEDKLLSDYIQWVDDNDKFYYYIELYKSEIMDEVKEQLESEYDFDKAKQEIADDLELDVDDEEVIQQATEKMENDIEYYIEDKTEEFEDAYHEIIDNEWRENFYNSGDIYNYVREWLNDEGMYYMSDIFQRYIGDYIYVWPHSHDGENLEDVIKQVAEELQDSLSIPVKYSSGYHSVARDDTNWIVETDSSIENDRGVNTGLEIVTPPMPLKEGIEKIKEFIDWANDYGCETNNSTGLHMNISVPEFSTESLDYVKLALFIGDMYVLNQFGRQYNTYTKSAINKIKNNLANFNEEQITTFVNDIKQKSAPVVSKLIHGTTTEKFTSINVKDSHVEFRSPGGDYLSSHGIDTIINTLLRLAMGLKIATSPELYKNEYYKKLYKLLSPSISTPEDKQTFALFAQYQAGLINFSTLKQQWVANIVSRTNKPSTIKGMQYARNVVRDPNEPFQKDIMYDMKNNS